jgi:chromosome segregation ATPase
MVSTAQQRLQEARGVLFAAESEVAQERLAKLESDERAATADVRRLTDEIAEHGKRLHEAEQNFQSLWGQRAQVTNSLRALDNALGEFPLPDELAAYEQKRALLVNQYESLSRQISDASIPSAQEQNTIQNLTFDKHRMEVAVSDLRLAIREARTGTRQRL